MRVVSFDLPPLNGKGLHQVIDDLVSIMCSVGSKMCVLTGRQDAAVTKDFLYFEQVDTGFNQMSGKTVPKRMRGNLFFIPQASTTLCRVFCTPPRSNGVVAV